METILDYISNKNDCLYFMLANHCSVFERFIHDDHYDIHFTFIDLFPLARVL